jgi:hypothetical protein
MDFRKGSKKRKFASQRCSKPVTSVIDYTLPIFSYKNELLECIRQHQTTIVIGETGSGKSTQLPQFLSELYSNEGEGVDRKGGCVVCTQPRRVAAVTIAERVASERNSVIGEEVGYSIRFNDRSGPLTRIKYVTDGVLLREIMTDPNLNRYSVVILDEAHERSLQTDVLMGLLKQLQQTKPSLRCPDMISSPSSFATSCQNCGHVCHFRGADLCELFPGTLINSLPSNDLAIEFSDCAHPWAAVSGPNPLHCQARAGYHRGSFLDLSPGD